MFRNLPLEHAESRNLLEVISMSFLDGNFNWDCWDPAEIQKIYNPTLDALYQ
jgi:hypothetical protein